MEALKEIHKRNERLEREKFDQGMKILTTQLQTIENSLSSTMNKEIKKQVQYQRQEIMYVQNTLLSQFSPLSLD
ncbi:MAG TPA: hypothetical protein VK142_01355 [Bacillota bacterium]|nr:hypothetical protein [Bacillota bacterium]